VQEITSPLPIPLVESAEMLKFCLQLLGLVPTFNDRNLKSIRTAGRAQLELGRQTQSILDRIIVAVELAGAPSVEGQRFDRLIFRRAQARQHIKNFLFPDIDGNREGYTSS